MKEAYKNLESCKKELLLKEFGLLQDIIGRHDRMCFNIKWWGVTLWAGIITYTLQNTGQNVEERCWSYMLSLLLIFLFFLLEISYSTLRGKAIDRVKAIEDNIKNTEHASDDFVFPSISSISSTTICDYIKAILKPRVFTPNLILIIVNVALLVRQKFPNFCSI